MKWFEDAKQKIAQKAWDELEALWMARLETDPTCVDEFLVLAKTLRQKDERQRADALLDLLAQALREAKAWPERLKVLREQGRLTKRPALFREPLEEALHHTFADRPSYRKALEASKFHDPHGNPVEKADKVELWLTYDEGELFFMGGRGAGIVIELNPDLGVCRLDFEKDKRVSVPLGAAPKYLTALPPGHILRRKLSDPEGLKESAAKEQAKTFAELLKSFGRPMTVSEVKDAMIGIVSEAKWGSWWTAARKHPQVVVTGTGAKATYTWNDSAEQADDLIRAEFDSADLRSKLDLGRKHSGRSQELADYLAATLAAGAEKAATTDPALAWEIFAVLEKLPGRHTSTFDSDALLRGPLAARIASAVSDRLLRVRALQKIRQENPDWSKVLAEAFFREEDPRVLTTIAELLAENGQAAMKDRLVDETLRYPNRHPHAFYWICKNLDDDEALPIRGGYRLLYQIIDAVGSDEFSSIRARMRDFFDKGGLVIRIVMQTDNVEEARKLLNTIERYGQVEEYRRENVKSALIMKYPRLREPEAEPIYATPDALAAKRAELDHLVKVEIPQNSKAIQIAREMGDLRENFEYKAARQRAEYLSARVGEIQGEVSRVRVLDSSQVDTTEVRIGTKIALRNGDFSREVTILGPWESAPEQGIYSNQSEVAKALLGHRPGDIVSFMGNDYEVTTIRTWNA
ncbi:MAG: GreA/GreB family elongation factor [Thermoanaerobaculia bacterium]|nr:GreA/GreB family elongation factor [Thermoanaerobaculia bacterium]